MQDQTSAFHLLVQLFKLGALVLVQYLLPLDDLHNFFLLLFGIIVSFKEDLLLSLNELFLMGLRVGNYLLDLEALVNLLLLLVLGVELLPLKPQHRPLSGLSKDGIDCSTLVVAYTLVSSVESVSMRLGEVGLRVGLLCHPKQAHLHRLLLVRFELSHALTCGLPGKALAVGKVQNVTFIVRSIILCENLFFWTHT